MQPPLIEKRNTGQKSSAFSNLRSSKPANLEFFRFTIIELLVVISIIALLIALLMPAIGMIRGRAQTTKAKSFARAIATAVKEYEAEYLQPPGFKGKKAWEQLLYGQDYCLDWASVSVHEKNNEERHKYDILMQVLTKINLAHPPTSHKNTANTAYFANLRNKHFLQPTPNFINDGYKDPWGHRFIVLLDYDFDKEIALGTETLHGDVFVYSCGPNGDDDYGDGDDVCSWK